MSDKQLTADAKVMLDESATEYARDVILERAIPDIRDGLKPVHRKIMWQTHLSKLSSQTKPDSLATVAGQTMKWHPHGDGSIENAATNLARSWLMTMPLLEIIGNGGSMDREPAASRYIKVRRTPAADLVIDGLNEDAVEMELNYDGTAEQPTIMPSALPSGLILGTSGIAWGMSTSIAPHNPIEMVRLCLAYIDNGGDLTTDQILRIVPGPDFPTGGTIVGRGGSKDEIETGCAKFVVKGSTRRFYDDDLDLKILEVYELPPYISTDRLVEQMGEVLEPLSHHFKIESIDNATRDRDVSIRVAFSKNANDEDIEKVEALLYQKTKLKSNVNVQNRFVHNGWARIVSFNQYLDAFLEFRRETLLRILNFHQKKDKKDLALVRASRIMIDQAEQITKAVSECGSRDELEKRLIELLEITEYQANFIAKQPIYRLNRRDTKWINELKERDTALVGDIERRDTIMSSDEETTKHLRNDLESSLETLVKAGLYDRKTEIVDEEEIETVQVTLSEAATVESKPVVVCVRDDLTMIRIGERAFENQESSTDRIIRDSVNVNTDEYVMGITKKGRVVTRLVDDLPHVNLDVDTEPLNHAIESLDSDDDFIAVVPVRDNVRVFAISEFGYGKTMDAKKIAPKTTTRAYIKKTGVASGLKTEGDTLSFVKVFTADEQNSLAQSELTFSVDTGKKPRTYRVDLARWVKRNDSGTSSGARCMPQLKDGEYKAENVQIITKDTE